MGEEYRLSPSPVLAGRRPHQRAIPCGAWGAAPDDSTAGGYNAAGLARIKLFAGVANCRSATSFMGGALARRAGGRGCRENFLPGYEQTQRRRAWLRPTFRAGHGAANVRLAISLSLLPIGAVLRGDRSGGKGLRRRELDERPSWNYAGGHGQLTLTK